MEHHIAIAPELIAHIGDFPITNTLMVAWLTTLILTLLAIFATSRLHAIPSGIQNLFELIIETGYQVTEDIAHSKAKTFFPWVMTFFLFILAANLLGLFPGFGTIGFYEMQDGHKVFVPLLRSANSDLNMTLGLALLSAFMTHYYAVKYLGFKDYVGKFISLNPIFLFVGLIELVSEFTKVASLSLRLFGNIFAGEVVLSTVAGLSKYTAFLVPLPFYFLEIIVAFVQAAVFMMLTLVFMSLLSEKHGSEH